MAQDGEIMRRRIMTPDRIIIHHSATADSGTLSWGAIRRYHLKNGWSDVGYHAGAELVGDQVECLFGRPDNLTGAHCRGQNSTTLGFCFVGDFDRASPSDHLLEVAARRVIVPWLLTYKLIPGDIRAHSEFSTKTCPGLMFDVERLRRIAAEIMKESR